MLRCKALGISGWLNLALRGMLASLCSDGSHVGDQKNSQAFRWILYLHLAPRPSFRLCFVCYRLSLVTCHAYSGAGQIVDALDSDFHDCTSFLRQTCDESEQQGHACLLHAGPRPPSKAPHLKRTSTDNSLKMAPKANLGH